MAVFCLLCLIILWFICGKTLKIDLLMTLCLVIQRAGLLIHGKCTGSAFLAWLLIHPFTHTFTIHNSRKLIIYLFTCLFKNGQNCRKNVQKNYLNKHSLFHLLFATFSSLLIFLWYIQSQSQYSPVSNDVLVFVFAVLTPTPMDPLGS